MTKISVKKALLIVFSIAILGLSLVFYLTNNKEDLSKYVTALVEKGDLVQIVSETGVVKVADKVDLSFEEGGKVYSLAVSLGDEVKSGDELVSLDYSNLILSKEKLIAQKDISIANLKKIQNGADVSDLAFYKKRVEQSESAYMSAKEEHEKLIETEEANLLQVRNDFNNLEDKTSFTITSEEQALLTAVDNLDNNKTKYKAALDNSKENLYALVNSQIPKINTALNLISTLLDDDDLENIFSIKDRSFKQQTESSFNEASDLLLDNQNKLNSVFSSSDPFLVLAFSEEVIKTWGLTFDSLKHCYTALENTITNTTVTETILNTYKASVDAQTSLGSSGISTLQVASQGTENANLDYENIINTYKNAVNQSQVALDDAVLRSKNLLANTENSYAQKKMISENKIKAAFESLGLAKADLKRLESPARKEDIDLNLAQIRQVEAEIKTIENRISKSKIKAPIDGKVAKINFEVGEQVGIAAPVISLINDNSYKIEVDISENDIIKVSLNDPVKITLDALGDDIEFSGKVTFIEPSETVVQDVIYYKTDVQFNNDYKKYNIKSGMTASVDVTTDIKKDALVVPIRAVITNNSARVVRVLENGLISEKKVILGILGNDGMVDILSGLKEGDLVVTSIKK